MTFLQIKYALAIADAGAMSRAAEQLFVSQSTLTSAIQQLESEVGIAIFQRTSRGVLVTNEGQEFLRHIRQIQEQYALIEHKYIDHKEIKQKFGVSSQHYSFVDKAFVEMVKKLDSRQFEFALRETRTQQVIQDVGELHSEVGILFLSDFNRRIITRMLKEQGLEFHKLIGCSAYVYLWRKHPLAGRARISFQDLQPYPCLAFEQGPQSSLYLAEEILAEKEYPRLIYASDRATMLNLMVGVQGYTLCSGIICEELNGSEFVAVPYAEDAENQNSEMEIGYITKQGYQLSDVGTLFLQEIRSYLGASEKTEGSPQSH